MRSAITLEGKLYMVEQERAFKAEDALRFLKAPYASNHWQAARHMGRLSDTYDEHGRSRPFWRAGPPGSLKTRATTRLRT